MVRIGVVREKVGAAIVRSAQQVQAGMVGIDLKRGFDFRPCTLARVFPFFAVQVAILISVESREQSRAIALPDCEQFIQQALCARMSAGVGEGGEFAQRIQRIVFQQEIFGIFSIAFVPGVFVLRDNFRTGRIDQAGAAAVMQQKRAVAGLVQFGLPFIIAFDAHDAVVPQAGPVRQQADQLALAGGPELSAEFDEALRGRCNARRSGIVDEAIAMMVGAPREKAGGGNGRHHPRPSRGAVKVIGEGYAEDGNGQDRGVMPRSHPAIVDAAAEKVEGKAHGFSRAED